MRSRLGIIQFCGNIDSTRVNKVVETNHNYSLHPQGINADFDEARGICTAEELEDCKVGAKSFSVVLSKVRTPWWLSLVLT